MKNFDLSRLNAIIVPLIAGGLGLLVGAVVLLRVRREFTYCPLTKTICCARCVVARAK